MGKASRWLRGLLLGGKKPAAVAGGETHKPIKEKRGWGFARSFRDADPQRRGVVEDEMSVAVNEVRKGASYREGAPRAYAPSVASSLTTGGVPSRRPPPAVVDDEEQQKRAIAVAAATAAVAEAAVAAAQAAAAVVRLTRSGRCPALYGAVGRKRDEWAAVRIQAAFRGYLARRALRALRGLVKLQALVRGHIVRKQAAETLRCMQALLRVQARARACRRSSESRLCNAGSKQTHLGPPTPQIFEPSLRANYTKKSDRDNSNLKRGDVVDFIDPNSSLQSWKWMDRWMEERYWDSREASWRTGGATDEEKNDKILEVDTGSKPHSNYRRRGQNLQQYSSSTPASDLSSRCFAAAVQDSPTSKDSFVQFSAASPSSADMQPPASPLRFALEAGESAYESPQLLYPASSSRPGSARGAAAPFTPAKSDCSRSFFGGYSDHPRSYMANTESSRAKLRSQSAPKQRPDYEKHGSTLRRVPVAGAAAGCGHSSSSSSSQRSASQLQLKFTSKDYPGSGRLDRMGMPTRF